VGFCSVPPGNARACAAASDDCNTMTTCTGTYANGSACPCNAPAGSC
jgi:hypothetical protein